MPVSKDGDPERMGNIPSKANGPYDGELQMFSSTAALDPNKLLEVRARAIKNREKDGYSGRASGPFVEVVNSWLKASVDERKTSKANFLAKQRKQLSAG